MAKDQRLLVFAPHPDDDILGCGGTLALAAQAGLGIRIVIVSSGERGLMPGARPDVRHAEALRALALLGLDEDAVEFWGYPDGAVPVSGPILARYRQAVRDFRPTRIFLPAPGEEHADHRAVTRGIVEALTANWRGAIWFYETMQPIPMPNTWQNIGQAFALKQEALACHVSQMAQFDYPRHCECLDGMRGLQSGSTHAEAFLAYDWDGSWEDFFYPQPLISVIVRSSRAVFLYEALRSLQRQQYPLFEVIVVWFGGEPPDLDGFSDLAIRLVDGVASRPANLNRGIGEARGQFIAFLDEDDVLLPQHFAALLPFMMGDPALDVCYAATRIVTAELKESGIAAGAVIRTMNSPYQRGQLLVRNCIAIHAAMVRRAVFNAEHFDETLSVYEDWEFWARLEQRGYRFESFDAVTTEYRLFDADPSSADPLVDLHQRKGYPEWSEAVLAKILHRCDVAGLRDMEALLSAVQLERDELGQKLHATKNELRELEADMAGLKAGLARSRVAVGNISGTVPRADEAVSRLIGLALPPKRFSLVCPVFNTPPELLAQALLSITRQSYPHWELCLVDDASDNPGTRAVLDNLLNQHGNDPRIRLTRLDDNGGIAAATRAGMALASGDYIGFFDHDDLLHLDALLEVALAIRAHGQPALLYTDSRVIDQTGTVLNISSKTEWAPESLLSFNYVNHFVIVRSDVFARLGDSFGATSDGAQDWDLLLRLSDILDAGEVWHIAKPLYDWRASEASLAYRSSAKPWMLPVARGVLEAGLRRKLPPHSGVDVELAATGFVTSWEGEWPAVNVIVPTHRNAAGLATCLAGLLEQTHYPSLSILVVANRCETPAINAVLRKYERLAGVTVLRDDRPFNWSALNNAAAIHCGAPLLLFLNDDVEILEPDWLKRMVRYLDLRQVAAVGALLTYPDGTVQHNGVWTDPQWIADNIRNIDHPLLAAQTRNVSAVTGACLLTLRNAFEQVGGFDESLPVNYNDVDYCMALRAAGYRIVQANDVKLCHHESKTRGYPEAAPWEIAKTILRDKWGEALAERYTPRHVVAFNEHYILNID